MHGTPTLNLLVDHLWHGVQVGFAMTKKDSQTENGATWESVHICPNCEYVINLADMDLRTITTGIVSCPRCEWAGKVEIQIVGGGGSVPKTPDQK